MPLLWIGLGFFGGYLYARHTEKSARERLVLSALQKDTQGILDGVGRLHQTGALTEMEDFKLHHGNEGNKVELLIKTKASPYSLPPKW